MCCTKCLNACRQPIRLFSCLFPQRGLVSKAYQTGTIGPNIGDYQGFETNPTNPIVWGQTKIQKIELKMCNGIKMKLSIARQFPAESRKNRLSQAFSDCPVDQSLRATDPCLLRPMGRRSPISSGQSGQKQNAFTLDWVNVSGVQSASSAVYKVPSPPIWKRVIPYRTLSIQSEL
jgi:hypothetical protein